MSGVFMYLKEYSRRLGWVHETATLDLSSMGIKAPTLPLEVTNLTSVTSLNLAKNAMPMLSSSINYMVSLTDLDVSDCVNLKQLSSEMGAMKQLTRIGLDGTTLMSPPPEVVSNGAEPIVEYLATLHAARFTHALHLSNIEVRQVDPAIGHIPGLTHLNLSSNKINVISSTLSKLVDLQTLELQSNDIVTLPRALEHCTSLTYVDLSDNRMEGPVFADLWVGAWYNIKHLNIKQNDRLSRLPLALSNWTALTKLEIDAQQFTQPPIEVLRKGAKPTVDYCSKFADTEGTVSKLELSGYKFKAYPMEICQLKGLKALLLQYNEIRVLPDEITVLQDLRELHLSHNPLLTVPPVLAHLTGLRALRLDNALLEELPDMLGKLVKLKGFSAVQNKLVNLPEDFGKMVSLTKINLDSNGLRSLPESLGNLKNLKDLSLTRNRIGWLPESMKSLVNVEEMRVSYNRLHALPREIGYMTSLIRLRCGNNMIQALPLELERLTLLEDLSFNSNQISTIPLVLGEREKSKLLTRDFCPQSTCACAVGLDTNHVYVNLALDPRLETADRDASLASGVNCARGILRRMSARRRTDVCSCAGRQPQ